MDSRANVLGERRASAMLNDGTALAARPFDLELGAIAHEIPSRNCNRNRRYKHTQVADTQVHAGLRQGNDLARDGTVAMTSDVQIDDRDYERRHNCRSNSRGSTDS